MTIKTIPPRGATERDRDFAIRELIKKANETTIPTGVLLAANNLSDLADAPTARSNLGIGTLREVLGAARTYYVRTDGSDSNTGLANTSGGAFLTIQKAIDTVATLDLSIYDVTIQLAAGTYSTTVGNVAKQCVGAGSVIILGDETTPANVVITTSGAMAVTDGGIVSTGISTAYSVRGIRFTSTGSGTRAALCTNFGGVIRMQNCEFGTGWTFHMLAVDGSGIETTGNWSVTSGSTGHVAAARGGVVTSGNRSLTCTVSGTPAFSNFANVNNCGVIQAFGWSFSGSATGGRYIASANGTIATGGGGASFFPGNSGGTTTTGGQYA